jgi:hypothetical protein
VQLFGGRINYGPQKEVLQASTFGELNYYANNFNDLASGMVLCFELLYVNNWHVLASGFTKVCWHVAHTASAVLHTTPPTLCGRHAHRMTCL